MGVITTRQEALAALGLGADATQAQIKMAYKDLVKRCHPDATGSTDASAYNRIVEAYQFLTTASGSKPLVHSKVMGNTTRRSTASNADYTAFQKKADKQKQRKKEEFEQKQKEFKATYEKQEADYKRAMEAIDAIRVARAIQTMVWANGMEKDSDESKD